MAVPNIHSAKAPTGPLQHITEVELSVPRSRSLLKVSRRALLSTLAAFPMLPGLRLIASAQAQLPEQPQRRSNCRRSH
jgi:hypothetical protein